MELCTDNAAMIACAARYVEAVPFPGYLELDAYATATPRTGVSGRLVLYGRPGCHLCDDARGSSLRVGAPFDEVDIEADDALLARLPRADPGRGARRRGAVRVLRRRGT